MVRFFVVLGLGLCAAWAGWADGLYAVVHADADWQALTGLTATQHFHYGWRAGSHDGYLFLTNTWAESGQPSAPSRLLVRGLEHGMTYRYWLPGLPLSAFASLGEIVTGNEAIRLDPRAGLELDYYAQDGRTETRGDGTLQWLPRLDDAVATVRLRRGPLPRTGHPQPYVVAQGWVSASGDTPADNRVEAGAGFAWRYRDLVLATTELRAGYAYRGPIDHRGYVNPSVKVEVGW